LYPDVQSDFWNIYVHTLLMIMEICARPGASRLDGSPDVQMIDITRRVVW
jgi:hypothetical protein